jgi:hypothetical protein
MYLQGNMSFHILYTVLARDGTWNQIVNKFNHPPFYAKSCFLLGKTKTKLRGLVLVKKKNNVFDIFDFLAPKTMNILKRVKRINIVSPISQDVLYCSIYKGLILPSKNG